jgi:hypothetical protein
LSPRKTRDIENALLDKGFRVDDTHHSVFWLYIHGKKTSIHTRISHGKEEYGDRLLGKMAVQLKLRRKQLDSLIDCPLDGEGYVELLVDAGHIKGPY